MDELVSYSSDPREGFEPKENVWGFGLHGFNSFNWVVGKLAGEWRIELE
jgi:hypothetical protein